MALLLAAVAGVFACVAARRRLDPPQKLRVAEIRIHPIKSCKTVKVQSASFDSRGLALDRRWIVLTDPGREMVTCRRLPAMLLLEPEITKEEVVVRDLRHPKVTALHVPIRERASAQADEVFEISYKGSNLRVRDCGSQAAAWFSAALGEPVKLVTYADDYTRLPLKEGLFVRYPDARAIAVGMETNFGDNTPLLVASEASIAEVSARVKQDISMDRFRPNIVVTGCRPFEEDTWATLDVGGTEVHLIRPCSRCAMPNIDPATATVTKEPNLTMLTNEFRRVGPKSYFGQNAVHARAGGTVRVGDTITVTERFSRYKGPRAGDTYEYKEGESSH